MTMVVIFCTHNTFFTQRVLEKLENIIPNQLFDKKLKFLIKKKKSALWIQIFW